MKNRRRTSGSGEAMFKLILTGDSGTGKSCLLHRYVKDKFEEEYHVTIGAEFEAKIIKIDDNYRVKLQIWDTAGQETFRSIIKTFYRNSAAVILIYNITKKKSFQSLEDWLAEAQQNAPKNAIFILMGTHLDLESQRQVLEADARKWMEKHQISLFFETSAKQDLNITKAFEEIAKQLFVQQLSKRKISQFETSKSNISLIDKEAEDKKDKKCCA